MRSSMGFHTITVFQKLTESEASNLYRAFNECSDVRVYPVGKDKKKDRLSTDNGEKKDNPLTSGQVIEYLEKKPGLVGT